MLKIFIARESGTTLIETVVALAVLGLTAVAFVGSLASAVNADIIADKQATAESLARSQLEWVKDADYVPEATTYSAAPVPSSDDYVDYSVTITAEPLGGDDDEGIQKVTVEVAYKGEAVLTVEEYKVDR